MYLLITKRVMGEISISSVVLERMSAWTLSEEMEDVKIFQGEKYFYTECNQRRSLHRPN